MAHHAAVGGLNPSLSQTSVHQPNMFPMAMFGYPGAANPGNNNAVATGSTFKFNPFTGEPMTGTGTEDPFAANPSQQQQQQQQQLLMAATDHLRSTLQGKDGARALNNALATPVPKVTDSEAARAGSTGP